MQIIQKSFYQRPANIRKILLIQLGDIGDVVWTTPSIRAVKESIPEASVSLLVKDGFGSLLAADPIISRIFEVRSYPGGLLSRAAVQWAFLKAIRTEHYDLAVDLRLGDRGAWMSFLSGAPLRVTMHHPGGVPWWRKFFFTHAAISADLPPQQGAAEQSLRFLRVLGIDTKDKIPRLFVPDDIHKQVREILAAEKIPPHSWVTVNPYSRWSYKEWTDKGWIDVFEWLWNDFKLPVLIVGSAEEHSKAEDLIRKCTGKVFNVAGKTNLAQLAGLLSQSLLHIGVDSAAPHIAAATGTPTVTIYGPSSWFDWAPPGDSNRIVLPAMDCVPCRQKGCEGSGKSRCLEELEPDRVKEVIGHALQNLPIRFTWQQH